MDGISSNYTYAFILTRSNWMVTFHFSQICNRAMVLMSEFLETNGQNLTNFCVFIDIDKGCNWFA